ncbi:probable ADP,ATP carrier protein At5g56450 isoform X1 [Cryptomeria japonica]|uniref:probable ADP,ATP carrier protein At5g56450 isoform X1 n=1 Tax=Cryptomeria japonica TaxID=3369 RepID=UPI0027DA39FA|nr:probable ADP,ATP carrier protein At5g56450 isoform X1 [Cryptomeria japonica]
MVIMSREEAWTNFPRDLLAGALMGGVAHTIVAPVERAKLLLQTQESNLSITGGKHRRFKGMLDCILRTVRDEGVLSLWRGNGSSVLRYYPSVALNFSLKASNGDPGVVKSSHIKDGLLQEDQARTRATSSRASTRMAFFGLTSSRVTSSNPAFQGEDLYRTMLISGQLHEKPLAKAPSNFLAGAAAGCTTLVIIYPLDIAHTRLAADIGKTEARQFKGLFHFLKTIHQKDGLRGVYRGLPASLQGMIVHRGLYFGGFDTIKDMMLQDASHPAFWKRWLAAQAVTTSAGFLSYPLDTVRRRMMMQSGLEHRVYRNTWDCWKKIYKMEGVTSFYRGALSNMFRSTGAALVLVLYDEIKNLMNSGFASTFDHSSMKLGEVPPLEHRDS